MPHIADEVRITILVIFALLFLSSISVFVAARLRPDHDWSRRIERNRTWWFIVGLFTVALVWSPVALICFLGFVSFLSLKEFLSMTPTRRADRRVLFYAYLSVIGQYFFAANEMYGMFVMFIPVLMFVWLPTRMLMIGKTDGFLTAAGTLHWALMITVFSLSHTAYLVVFQPGATPRVSPEYPSLIGTEFPGPGLLLFLIVITEANVIFQYAWGKSIGLHLVAPQVSPSKTVAGTIGGLVSASALAVLIGPKLTMLDAPRSLLAGLLISATAFAGSLCFSALKRDMGIKHFGATLPGHGGVLDRIDSLVFTAPIYFHFVNYCYG